MSLGNGGASTQHWITGISVVAALAVAFYVGILWQQVTTNTRDIDQVELALIRMTGVVESVKAVQDQRTTKFDEIFRRLDKLETKRGL